MHDPDTTTKAAALDPKASEPFWRRPLASLTIAEWESLCDGCGRCCLVKLEDEDNGTVHFTDVACTLLDLGSCRCSDYPHRQAKVSDCVKLTADLVQDIPWLPPTCAYRLVEEGRDLQWWHPLVSGRPETVHEAGISVRGRISVSEDDVDIEDLPGHIKAWPARWPKKARKPPRAASALQSPAAEDPGDPAAQRSKP